MKSERFESEVRLLELVRSFECGEVPERIWNHAAHLAVAMWYLVTLEEADATVRLIDGLRSLDRNRGAPRAPGRGYHETITIFWLAIARAFLSGCEPGLTRLEVINRFVERYAEAGDLILEHYSPSVLHSWQARSRWVEPDLRPLAVPTPADPP